MLIRCHSPAINNRNNKRLLRFTAFGKSTKSGFTVISSHKRDIVVGSIISLDEMEGKHRSPLWLIYSINRINLFYWQRLFSSITSRNNQEEQDVFMDKFADHPMRWWHYMQSSVDDLDTPWGCASWREITRHCVVKQNFAANISANRPNYNNTS